MGQLKDELSKLDDVDAPNNLSSMFDDLDIGDFTGQIDGLDGALDLLGGGAKACGLALAGMFTASNNLSSMFDDLDIGDFTGQIDGLDGALDLLGGGAKACGLALAGMFTASVIDGAKSFDKAITDLEINLGVTEKQAENLHKKIKDFSDGGYDVGWCKKF